MKVYRIIFKEYVETNEYFGGPTYILEDVQDQRIFSSEFIANQYAEYARDKSNTIEGYTIVEQEIIDQLCMD